MEEGGWKRKESRRKREDKFEILRVREKGGR